MTIYGDGKEFMLNTPNTPDSKQSQALIDHEVAAMKRRMLYLQSTGASDCGLTPWTVLRLITTIETDRSRASVAAVAPQRCKWCEQGDLPMFLDNDGTRCDITHQPGVLSHAHEECWWPCLRYGFEIHWPAVASSPAPAERSACDHGVPYRYACETCDADR